MPAALLPHVGSPGPALQNADNFLYAVSASRQQDLKRIYSDGHAAQEAYRMLLL